MRSYTYTTFNIAKDTENLGKDTENRKFFRKNVIQKILVREKCFRPPQSRRQVSATACCHVYLPVFLSASLFVRLYAVLSFACLHVYLSICLSVCLPVCLAILLGLEAVYRWTKGWPAVRMDKSTNTFFFI